MLCVENFKSPLSAQAEIHAIQTQAQLVKCEVDKFVNEVTKYGEKLGAGAPQGFYRGSLAKINWAKRVAPKAAALFEKVEIQLRSIQLLYHLYTRCGTSSN